MHNNHITPITAGMPRGNAIGEKDIGKIELLHQQGKSLRDIAKEVERSYSGVKYVVDCIGEKRKPHQGRKRKLSDRDERDIRRKASNNVISCAKIKAESDYGVSTRTINRVLGRCDNLQCVKMLTKPPISAANKRIRLEFAHDHQTWNAEWTRVFWSDEKSSIWMDQMACRIIGMICGKTG